MLKGSSSKKHMHSNGTPVFCWSARKWPCFEPL
jgi:hypothetical protein